MTAPGILIKSCLDRLHAESTRHKELRDAVDAAMKQLEEERQHGDESAISADRYWAPFKIACQHNLPAKARETALDCLQKLIAHNILPGAAPLNNPSDVNTSAPITHRRSLSRENDLSQLDTSPPPDSNGSAEQDEELHSENARNSTSAAPVFAPRSTSLLPSAPGDTPHYPPNPFLIDEIIHTVCTTFTGIQSDETVQLQVLKVLLTAVTSTACEVHEVSLLKVIQTCFNIHLHSRTQVNQMTAKASLTQMVNLIFSRMERYAEVLAKSLETGSMVEIEKLTRLESKKFASSPAPKSDAKEQAASDAAVEADNVQTPDVDTVGPNPDGTAQEEELLNGSREVDVPAAGLETSTDGVNSDFPEADGTPAAPRHDDSDSPSVAPSTQIDVTASLPQEPEETTAASPTATGQMPSSGGNNPYDPTIAYYNELLRKDVFLVFRLLCRLSLTSDDSQSPTTTFNAANLRESLQMDEVSQQSTKARQLALELIMSVLNNCGPVFQHDDLYIGLIRQNLCLSISRNGVTTNPTLFELSLSIFLMVARFYRSKLKTEIEVLLNTIYLHILEMGNSTYNQKRMVLQGLLKICENPQTLADLYLNYDCDIAMVSLFERIVSACSRVAQGREPTTPSSATGLMGLAASVTGMDTKEQNVKAQERRLKLRGLCCLVALVNSLGEWSKEAAPTVPLNPGRQKDRRSTELSRASTTSKRDGGEKGSLIADASRNDGPRTSTSDNPTKNFLDALAPSNQANPKLVYKHPLHSVSMDQMPYNFPNTSNTSLQSTTTATPEEDSLQIESMASRKQTLRNDIRLFNMKPTKGIKALIQHNFVEDDVVSIANFLHVTDGLTKAAIGEYLGEGDSFNIEVMHAFIDALDFTGMAFVPALRKFLQTFRLPGESQKIDRIMEKFADRYCETNPDIFARADTAYTLAFSVIMLNTDQHSPQMKHRMDKAAFIKNNRGINDEGDLPDDFLGAIFDEVANNEILMEEEHAGKLAQMAIGWGAGDINDRQRMELYKKEMEHVQKKSQQLIENANRTVAPFRTASNPELARPMFGMASWPLIAVFSLAFEAATEENDASEAGENGKSGEPKSADLCLEGFTGSIRLASIFRMETERDAFVTSLSKLTGLSHIHDIRPKNIKAIKSLILIANVFGEYLESSWMQVLKAISQLERLQLIANRGSFDDGSRNSGDTGRLSADNAGAGLPYGASGTGTTSLGTVKTIEDLSSLSRPNPTVEKLIAEFHNQATVVAVDRIFTNTVNLSATAIIHFFRCLCHVSMQEVGLDPSTPAGGIPQLLHSGSPRMYLLQKIVEIAYYNMPRIRFEWTQIWRILQPYFNTVACHPNLNVSTFAVDSLRQLSMKFLEREELGHYSAQNEFLKSFEWIMKQNSNPTIRELILSSMSHMIAARAKSIRSGWRSIFVVLAKAAQSSYEDEKMFKAAFGIVQTVFRDNFDSVNGAGAFVDYVSCLAEFALIDGSGQAHDEIVMGSIQLLQSCANYLVLHGGDVVEARARRVSHGEMDAAKYLPTVQVNGAAPPVSHSTKVPSQPYLLPNGLVSEEHFFLKWFPIFSAFSRVIIDSESVTVRTRTIDALFDTLNTAGHLFDIKYWKTIHRTVVLPIFADLKDQSEPGSQQVRGKDADTAIWVHGLRLYVDLTSSFFEQFASAGNAELIRGVLDLLIGMLQRRDEKLATTGGICLHGFVRDNLGKINKGGCWGVITEGIEEAFRTTMPAELLNCDYGKGVRKEDKHLEIRAKDAVAAGYAAAGAIGPAVTLDTLDFEHVLVKCVTHLELVQTLRDVAFTRLAEKGRRGSIAPMIDDKSPSHRASIVDDLSTGIPKAATPDTAQSAVATPRVVLAITIVPTPYRQRWLRCLYDSYAVARAFNEENDLRYAIYKRGLVPQLPHLVKQETVSFATYLRMLFAIYQAQESITHEIDDAKGEEGIVKTDESILPELMDQTLDVLGRYVEFLNDQRRNQLHIGLWSPVVVMVFRELLSMDGLWDKQDVGKSSRESVRGAEIKGGMDGVTQNGSALASGDVDTRYILKYFKLAVKMMGVDRPEVRAALQDFMEKIGDIYL